MIIAVLEAGLMPKPPLRNADGAGGGRAYDLAVWSNGPVAPAP